MSRYYTKPLSILATHKIHLVPKMSPLGLIETMENISFWKDRNSTSAVKLFTQCSSRVISLLPELKLSEIVRILFLYNKTEIESKKYIDKIQNFILNEVDKSKIDGNPFCNCYINDLLLLYKGFERNGVYDSKIHNYIIDEIIKQKKYMTQSDICLFLKSHFNYLIENENKGEPIDLFLCPKLVKETASRLLECYNLCVPEDLTCFIECISNISKFYGNDIYKFNITKLNYMFDELSKYPVRFDIKQILRIINSCCKLIKNEYLSNEEVEMRKSGINFINSLLMEVERRYDILGFEECLDTFYHLDSIGYWNFRLMKGILYCILNNVKEVEDARKVCEMISRNQKILLNKNKEDKEGKNNIENNKNKERNEIKIRERASMNIEVDEMIRRYKKIIQNRI